MISALLLTLVVSGDTCGSCACVGRDVSLCSAHGEAERSTMALVKKQLESADESERIAALEALAALTTAHENAPSERVVNRIATALADPSFAVRTRAAELLGRPQHALAGLTVLEKTLAAAEKEMKSATKECEKRSKQLAKGDLALEKRRAILDELQACRAQVDTIAAWMAKLTAQLATFPDDRSVDAICAHTSRDVPSANLALARLGSRRAVEAVIDGVRCNDQALAQARASVDSRRSLLSSAPEILQGFEQELKQIEDGIAASNRDIVSALAEHGVRPPAPPHDSYDDWVRWFEANEERFPQHLPGITSPAW
jgi:DNA repair exonuclease SbcCD ATPase subunit